MKKSVRKTRSGRLCGALKKDMQSLAKKAVMTTEGLGYSMYTPEGQATTLYALDGINLFVSLPTLERRAMATEKEFGKHAIRRAIHGTLKTRKSLWEVLSASI